MNGGSFHILFFRRICFRERKVTALTKEPAAQSAARPHTLHMENREKLSLAGVEDVSGFDENLILLQTSEILLLTAGDPAITIRMITIAL